MNIKRYKIISEDWGYEENPRGMFVMVSDHIAALEAVKADCVIPSEQLIRELAVLERIFREEGNRISANVLQDCANRLSALEEMGAALGVILISDELMETDGND